MRSGAVYRNGVPLLDEVWRASHWWQRTRGLLGRPRLGAGQALWIVPCDGVHTVGMDYPLDLIFLDRDAHVLRLVAGLKPWRICRCPRAQSVLELAAGGLELLHLELGQRLEWQMR